MTKSVKVGWWVLALVCFFFCLAGTEASAVGPNDPGGEKPKLLKQVTPVYPREALKQKLQGNVVLEALINVKGLVQEVKVSQSAHPLLDAAAIDAVKQWKYQPMIDANGKAKNFRATLTVNFALKKEEESPKDLPACGKLVKKVSPEYPQEARATKIQGTVFLELWVNEKGTVDEVNILESANPQLNDAAVAAVRQWQYEPSLDADGTPRHCRTTVTITFTLN